MTMNVHCKFDKMVPLENLAPHPGNENKHNEQQIELLASIIAKDGMRHPITVSNLSGYIVMGHGRLEALKSLEMPNAPVVFQDFDDPIQEMRVRNADNNIAKYSEIDKDQFHLNLMEHDLDLNDLDLGEFGLIPVDLKEMAPDLGDDFGEDVGSGSKDKQTICPKCGEVI